MKRIFILFLFTYAFHSMAQNRDINYGDVYFESYEYKLAIQSYKNALKKTEDKEQKQYLYGQISECYANLFQYLKAEEYFSLLMSSGEPLKPQLYIDYGNILKLNGKYVEAKKQFERYKELMQDGVANSHIQSVEWAIANANANVSSYRVFLTDLDVSGQSLGYSYYGKGLIYCHGRNKPKYGQGKRAIFDIDYAISENNLEFIGRNNFFPKIHFDLNEISPCLSEDESQLFFAANAAKIKNGEGSVKNLELDKKGISNYKIYFAEKEDAEFVNPQELPFNSVEFNCIHPSLSSDKKILIFSSDMPGGFGGFDLYKSELQEDSTWGSPVNLGRVVNTSENEIFPWLANGLLFFSSKGFKGYGGYDIFVAKFDGKGEIKNLKNMGHPVNSFRDDIAFIAKGDASTGYFSSNRDREDGGDQVYFFRESRPGNLSLSFLESKKDTLIPLTLTSLSDTSFHQVEAIDRVMIPKTSKAKTFTPILFQLNDITITASQRRSADSAVAYMKAYPETRLEVKAYTDSRGRSEYNMGLSKKRAAAVKSYLVSKGVSAGRITTIGMGETQLLNECADGVKCSEEKHAVNRRVEMMMKK